MSKKMFFGRPENVMFYFIFIKCYGAEKSSIKKKKKLCNY